MPRVIAATDPLITGRSRYPSTLLQPRAAGMFRLDSSDIANSVDVLAVLELRISLERVELVRLEDSDPYTSVLVRAVQEPATDAEEVRALKARGLAFEHFELPGATWHDDVAVMEGVGSAAWFKDSEGNIMCIDDATVA